MKLPNWPERRDGGGSNRTGDARRTRFYRHLRSRVATLKGADANILQQVLKICR